MKITNLLDYFERIEFDWTEDLENLRTICHYTKTRVDPNKNQGQMSYGAEQSFLVKAVCNHIKAKKFFEIGTGRGTACYSVALEETIDQIVTVDIVHHFIRKREAIGYREAIVSNEDIYKLIPFKEKQKIAFKHTSDVSVYENNMASKFDLAFIDGNHTDIDIIKNDFRIANKLVRDGGIILFDDYHPTRFAVKEVVDEILDNNPNFDAELVCFHGHLFDKERMTSDTGIVIVTK